MRQTTLFFNLSIILFTFCLLAAPARADSEFPLRPYYPEVPVISTDELVADYDDAIIVDIRSQFEYDVARINKAVLLPIAESNYAAKLGGLRAKDATTPIAFYCNGHTCAKSYQATQKAISLGFVNVYAYDGGIFDWIEAAPELATLMNETPARQDRIITSDEFNLRLLDYQAFGEASKHRDAVVVDIRDPFQRVVVPRLKGVRNIPLDSLLELVVSRIWTEKKLLFFDAVGKQVRWLQYFLESNGYHDYAFLKGGVRAVAENKADVRPVLSDERFVTTNQDALLAVLRDSRINNDERAVLTYLIANVKFNNYIVVDIETATTTLGMNRAALEKVVRHLTVLKYIAHSILQDSLVVQIDPRLAWKGEVRGKTWKDKLSEFENDQTPVEAGICTDQCD